MEKAKHIPWNIVDKDQLGYEASYHDADEKHEPHVGPRVTNNTLDVET